MPNIVLEGPDGSGKSTLATYLEGALDLTSMHGGGPSKGPGEVIERAKQFLRWSNVIFDRHPCVSQNIYRTITKGDLMPNSVLDEFYSSKPILVYCRDGSLEREVYNHEIDSQECLTDLERAFPKIERMYEVWALQRSTFIYRIGDPKNQLARAIAAYGGWQ